MNIGSLLVYIAGFSSLGAAVMFYREGKTSSKTGAVSKTGARLFFAAAVATALASVALLDFLLSHQFQYEYVAKYSSRSLPVFYLISAFWAGQEGTFLLWALLTGIMGLVFLRKSGGGDPIAMTVISVFQLFLFALIIVKSPFVAAQAAPPDGAGLNPLLQDPWMVIHPPILFIGYAATVFPFALVVSALARKKYSEWHEQGFAWAIFASLTLGAGIIIGGFWAYEVLGWGGYWGWDPVENSSLVPWIALLALIHGLLVQRANGALARTNMFLALCAFILVLYATFLTRSGVLADFSVHSFVDLGINNYLIGSLVVSAAVGFGLLAVRTPAIRPPKLGKLELNRETALLLSIFVLVCGGLFTFAGMSSPLITGIVGKASQVDTTFYNKVNMPVAIGISLLLGITPFLGWKDESKGTLLKKLSLPLGLTVLACLIAYVGGVTTPALLLFVGAASFGMISNCVVAFRQYKTGILSLGGPVSHIGACLLFIGIVGSGMFDESKKLVLKQGVPQEAFGIQFTFQGVSDEHAVKPSVNIQVADGKSSYIATPKLYFSEYNQSMLREPSIKIFPLRDLYISPLEITAHDHNAHRPTLEISKGETKEIAGYQVNFVKFDMSQHGENGGMAVGAVLQVKAAGELHEVTPLLTFDQKGERNFVPATLPSLHYPTKGLSSPQVILSAISVEDKKVLLEITGIEEAEAAVVPELLVDISMKPLMMVVWTGVVLIIAGTALALKRRIAEKT